MRGEKMKIQHFFDPDTSTLTYVISKGSDAVIIDPVLDYDPASGKIEDKSVKSIIDYVKSHELTIHAILETHAHADHISSSQILKQIYPNAILGIGERIKPVQEVFKAHFNLAHLKPDASQFDKLFSDFEEVNLGSLKMKAIPTPGHTPACMSFLFEDVLFTGDALFMPDSGTGRCDFPKGSADTLFESITKNIYTLPDATKIFVGHDYLPGGRELKFETTVGESKNENIHLKSTTRKSEFISFREGRDKTLKAPRLLLPSIQVNIDAGHLPPKEQNEKTYLKMPLNLQLTFGKL